MEYLTLAYIGATLACVCFIYVNKSIKFDDHWVISIRRLGTTY